MIIDDLKLKFQTLCKYVEATPEAAEIAWNNLVTNHQNIEGSYHTLTYHIARMSRDLVKIRHHCANFYEMHFGVFYHDVFSSEDKSAEFAKQELVKIGMTRFYVDLVCRFIIASKHDKIQIEPDAQIFCDLDLLGLADTPKKFDIVSQMIRKEYAWVSDKQFWNGRKQFFKKMLDKKFIFQHPIFKKYESRARENLSNGIKQIESILTP